MSSSDALEIFRQFWPTKGFAGVEPHLPGWTRNRARSFACRHGIKMIPEKRDNLFREAGSRGGNKQPASAVQSMETRFLSARW